ncbi:sugar transferase [Nocardioides sp.]|uniref:sugar transferase n=1 Tax=Nocardioides sp. TaxID=35761 RepID=UPI0035697978
MQTSDPTRGSLRLAARSRALRYLPATAFALDLVLATAVGFVASLGREHLPFFDGSVVITETLGIAGPLMLTLWIATIAAFGGYRSRLFGDGAEEYRLLVRATVAAAGLVGVGCYLTKYSLSRGFFLMAFALGALALLTGRVLLRRAVHRARRSGALSQSVLIAGLPSSIDEVSTVIRRESWLGYRILGAVVPPHHACDETSSGVPVLGTTDEAIDLIAATEADVVLIASGALASGVEMRQLVWALEGARVRVVVAPNVTDVSSERVRVRPVGGLPLVHIDPPGWIGATRRAKRTFDLVTAGVLLLLSAPVLAVAAAAVRLHDGGPVLFRQVRVGRNGDVFHCLKLRTMVHRAEDLLPGLCSHHGADAGTGEGLFKMRQDPRITRPGQWLRRFSLDELPQLVNVIRGEMSLVGPRPPLPTEVAAYTVTSRRRLQVRPGMTGLWQVSGRSDLSWSEAIRLDLYYVDNWSMLQDLSILAKTWGAVLSRRGAY